MRACSYMLRNSVKMEILCLNQRDRTMKRNACIILLLIATVLVHVH